MPAKIISFTEWKAAHPPALICFQRGLACMLAWNDLWLKILSNTTSQFTQQCGSSGSDK